MVRRDGPTDGASATVRQHERQLPLLLDLFHNQSHNQVQMDMCDLLLGWSRPRWQLVSTVAFIACLDSEIDDLGVIL